MCSTDSKTHFVYVYTRTFSGTKHSEMILRFSHIGLNFCFALIRFKNFLKEVG